MRPSAGFATALVSLAAGAAIVADAAAQEAGGRDALWEVGIGGGGSYAPHYPAADESKPDGLALPYLIYRGDIFRLGDDSIAKGVFVETERVEFDVSLDASFDADSDDNKARRGMPDLDFLGEIGPQLAIVLRQWQASRLELELPVRAVFSTDFGDFDHRGYVFNPELSWQSRGVWEGAGVSVELGASFATEKLQDYFYEVEAAFATPERAAYDADGGYMGSELGVGVSFGVGERARVFVGGDAAYHGGAANEGSVLHRDEVTFSVSAGFLWSLYESEARAR